MVKGTCVCVLPAETGSPQYVLELGKHRLRHIADADLLVRMLKEHTIQISNIRLAHNKLIVQKKDTAQKK